jgi:ferredoxin-NADP reductase
VVSEDRAYPGARGLVGTVAAGAADWSGRSVFVCGPEAMVRHSVGELKAAGVPAASIRREQFDFAATPPSEEANTWEAR